MLSLLFIKYEIPLLEIVNRVIHFIEINNV